MGDSRYIQFSPLEKPVLPGLTIKRLLTACPFNRLRSSGATGQVASFRDEEEE